MRQLEDWGINSMMKIKKKSLALRVYKYLVIFSVIILAFLWFFQVVFLKSFYKSVKTRDLASIARCFDKENYNIDNISYKKEVCIEITNKYGEIINASSFMTRGCFMDVNNNYNYKYLFINSGKRSDEATFTNPMFNNETLIYMRKLSNNKYVFISTSIDPMDSTTDILKRELIIVTTFVLLLSFIIGYIISKNISEPIEDISNDAKEFANGNLDVKFKEDGNIDELNELSKTLNRAEGELKKTDNLRRDLIANVSHDLKTPLTMIKAYGEMTRDLNSDKPKKVKENMNVIIDEADRLSLLVKDTLELSKLESNIYKLKKEDFDLVDTTNNILKRYKIYEEKDGYKFIFNHANSTEIVNADKERIEEVIYNLINNTINYTGKDKTITLNILNEKNKIIYEVKDTGKGIKKEDMKYIWDRYFKDSKKHTRNTNSTGLGLSIVKSILVLHKYKYGVYSTPKGSTFYFEIEKSRKN